MPGNPYDEIARNIAAMVEDMMKKMDRGDSPQFIGCTIVSGGSVPLKINNNASKDNIYEIIDTEEQIFITAEIPAGIDDETLDIIIDEMKIILVMDGREAEIKLESAVIPEECEYVVQNGIIDIVCPKIKLLQTE